MTAIDHAKEARALLSAARTAHDADRLIAEAHVHATLALAEEQRTANLIALAAQIDGDDRAERDLAERVIIRLGLREAAS